MQKSFLKTETKIVKKIIHTNALLLFVLILGLVLRLPLLNGSFWLDEAAQALESSRPLSQQFDIIPDFQPPLIHLIVFGAIRISKSEWWLRSVAALIPGLISIWATYKIGEKLLNKETGFLASLLLATNSFHIFYSQELRPYSLPTMFACLTWMILLSIPSTDNKRATKKTKEKKTFSNRTVLFMLFSIGSILGLYSSYLYPFLLASQITYVAIQRRDVIVYFLSSVFVSLIAFGIWLPVFFQQLSAGGQVRNSLPGWETAVSISQIKSIPLVFGKFIFGVLDIQPSILFISTFFVIIVIITVLLWQTTKETHFFGLIVNKNKTQTKSNAVISLLIWLIVPLLTSWIVSFFVPVVRPKRVLFLLPAFLLLIACLTELKQKKRLSIILISVFFSLNIFSTISYYTNPLLQRENWRHLHQKISQKFSPQNTVLVFVAPAPFSPWVWYDQGNFPTVATNTLHINQVSNLSQTLKKVTLYDQVLVFDYLRSISDPNDKILSTIEEFGYKGVGVLDQPNIGFVRIYVRKNTIIGNRLEI